MTATTARLLHIHVPQKAYRRDVEPPAVAIPPDADVIAMSQHGDRRTLARKS